MAVPPARANRDKSAIRTKCFVTVVPILSRAENGQRRHSGAKRTMDLCKETQGGQRRRTIFFVTIV